MTFDKVPAMKLASVLLASAVLAGCQNESKLDSKSGGGDLETRVKKLEEYKEELEWLKGIYKQQKAQQEAQEREEPAPDAVFAVDVASDVKGGQVEGSNSACVTVVEAWDFA